MRIIIVEDDPILGPSLRLALEKQMFGADLFVDGESGLLACIDNDYAAAIVDVNLPGIDGFQMLRELRAQRNDTPVLMLTALDRIRHRVEGLDSGADDYLVKPFDLDELLARLRALIRRSAGRSVPVLRCRDVELDPSALVAKRDGTMLHLPAKEFNLLRLLMERAGRYVTKSDIEFALYDGNSQAESNTIEVTIYNLRRKLGAEFIRSIRGVGYMVER